MATYRPRRLAAFTVLWRAVVRGQQPGAPALGERLSAVPRMVREAVSGRYAALGRRRLALLALGLAYLLPRWTSCPEAVVPLLGLADDSLVALWLAGTFLAETDRYLAWERSARRVIVERVRDVGRRSARSTRRARRRMVGPAPWTPCARSCSTNSAVPRCSSWRAGRSRSRWPPRCACGSRRPASTPSTGRPAPARVQRRRSGCRSPSAGTSPAWSTPSVPAYPLRRRRPGVRHAVVPAAGGGLRRVRHAPVAALRPPPRRPVGRARPAGCPLAGLTAWQCLVDIAEVQPGQRVLIHAAAGGVGHLAVQIAKARGAHVIGTASAGKHDLLAELGVDEAVDYRSQKFEDVVEPVDVDLRPHRRRRRGTLVGRAAPGRDPDQPAVGGGRCGRGGREGARPARRRHDGRARRRRPGGTGRAGRQRAVRVPSTGRSRWPGGGRASLR